RVPRLLCVKHGPFANTENRTNTSPRVRCETCKRNWIAQCKRSQDGTDRMVVIDSFTSKNRDCRVLEDIEAVFAGVQGKSFNAHTKVAVEEIFYIAAAAPGVISTNVMVKGAEHGVAFTGTLSDIQQPKSRIVLGVGESIGAPEIHIPFIVAVPLRTRRRRDLLHFFFRDFFSRIAIGAENLGE